MKKFVKFKIYQGTYSGSYPLTHLIYVDNIGQVQPKYPQLEAMHSPVRPYLVTREDRDGEGGINEILRFS